MYSRDITKLSAFCNMFDVGVNIVLTIAAKLYNEITEICLEHFVIIRYSATFL